MIVKNAKELSRVVCERDKFICHVCKKDYSYPVYFNEKNVNQYVAAHHVKTKGAHPELKLETDICVTVCNLNQCHNKIHSANLK